MLASASKFIDIEAKEAEAEADDLEYSDTDVDFVVDDVFEEEPYPRAPLWKDLNEWEGDSGPEALEAIAQGIVERYHGTSDSTVHEYDEAMDRLPGNEDVIWRIRVKIGWERDAVLRILLKALAPNSVDGIRSAFSRDDIQGYIYVESPSRTALHSILDGVAGVARSRRGTPGFFIDAVDLHDRPLLLDMGLKDIPVTENSWIRVCSGKYKGDLGLLHSVDKSTLICAVYLVPRIRLDRKRKRGRPIQSLFDVSLVQGRYGEQSVQKRNGVFLFKDNCYEMRLLQASYHLSNLATEGINAREEELDFFRKVPELWDRANIFISPIKIGDRIRVISGPYIGMAGNIVNLSTMTATFSQNGSNQDAVEVLMTEIRKDFALGDFVQIISGSNRGTSGFVVGIEGQTACIYTRFVVIKDGVPFEFPGNEINVNTTDIEWKSTPERLSATSSTYGGAASGPQPFPEVHTADVHRVETNVNIRSLTSIEMAINQYKHMEVSIHVGHSKGQLGVIKGVHFGAVSKKADPLKEPPRSLSAELVKKGIETELLFDVLTTTRATNVNATYRMQHLREKYTQKVLDKACWIPARHRQILPMDTNVPATPTREPDDMTLDDQTKNDEAWDPKLHLSPPTDNWPSQPSLPPANWLLTHSHLLLNKKLDVRVQGTRLANPPWQNGKFEGQLGFMVLTKPVQSLDSSIVVKTGFGENRAALQVRHVVPEVTTERPTYQFKVPVKAPIIRQILSVPGIRVVIIGPDCSKSMEYIGDYAIVQRCPYTLGPDEGLVQIATIGPNWGKHVYVPGDSICRSDRDGDAIDWFGKRVE